MQRLSVRFAFLIIVLALSGVSFRKVSSLSKTTSAKATQESRQASYYWFSYPGEVYNDYATIAYEEEEMWIYYDAPVNQSPGGGTLIERGYYDQYYPHDLPPVEFLYVHE